MTSLEHFQGRGEAIAAFDGLWAAPSPWILAFTGLSGHGKSTLLNWIEANRCRSQNLPYALIGIGEYAGEIRSAFQAMLETPTGNLREQLSHEHWHQYWQERRTALQDRNRRQMALHQQQIMHGSAEGVQQMSANLAEAYWEMEAATDEVICDAWLDCLETLSDQAQLVVLLDDYDTFQDSATIKELKRFWQVMEWAKGRIPGLRVVLACREAIRHQNDLRVFDGGLICVALAPLKAEESDALLVSLGVTDGAYRQAVFNNLAEGHPLITRMAAEAWREAAGALSAADVPQQTNRQDAIEWVQARILDRLSGPLQEAVRWAALLRWFEADTLEVILNRAITATEFRALTHYSFVIRPRAAPQAWACHDLVRRVQMSYLQQAHPDTFRVFHQKAHNYHRAREEQLESIYHQYFFEPEGGFTAWQSAEREAAFAFDHTTWSALIEIGLAPELRLPPPMLAEVYFRSGRRHYYRAEWEQAVDHLDQALERFNAIGDRLGQANVLMAIGKLSLNQDDPDSLKQGTDFLEQALALYQAIDDRVGPTNIYSFKSQWFAQREQYSEALQFGEMALELALPFIPDHPFTEWLKEFVQSLTEKVREAGLSQAD